jgi:hypothetical protein
LVVFATNPPAPTTHPTSGLVKRTACSRADVPLDCVVHDAPASTVLRITPPSPTA